MSIIGAETDDWRPNRSSISPGLWILAFVGAVLLCGAVAALLGTYLNGDGSPYLLSI